jgi:hypothetical protein
MAKSDTYKLKLSGEGLQLEQEISSDVAHSIVRFVFGGGIPAVTAKTSISATPLIPSSPLPASNSGEVAALSVREFLEAHSAKRIPEQIATIALYLKLYQSSPVFGSKDLIRNFEDAQEPVPGNLSRDIAWATKIGWIAPKSGAKKIYYLTGTGETAVNSKFPEDVKKKTKVSFRPRKKQKSKSGKN